MPRQLILNSVANVETIKINNLNSNSKSANFGVSQRSLLGP